MAEFSKLAQQFNQIQKEKADIANLDISNLFDDGTVARDTALRLGASTLGAPADIFDWIIDSQNESQAENLSRLGVPNKVASNFQINNPLATTDDFIDFMDDQGWTTTDRNEFAELLASGISPMGAIGSVKNLDYDRAIKFLSQYVPKEELIKDLTRNALVNYGKALQNPAVRRRDKLRYGDPETIFERTATPEHRYIDDAYELLDNVLVPVAGDTSRAGGNLTKIRGVDLQQPVEMQGGYEYPLLNDMGWASMYNAAKNKQKNFLKAYEETGRQPIGVYSAMSDAGLPFSHMPVESMINQIKTIGIPQKSIKAFNKHIREKFPSFVGVDSPDVFEQLRGNHKITKINDKGETKEGSSGDLRKYIVNRMKNKEWENLGFPVYGDVVDAVKAPELKDIEFGESGGSMFLTDPTGSLVKGADHLTYDTGIRGKYFGSMNPRIPPNLMFPNFYRNKLAELATKTDKEGRSLAGREDLVKGSIRAQHIFEVPTNQWADDINEWLYQDQMKNFDNEIIRPKQVIR